MLNTLYDIIFLESSTRFYCNLYDTSYDQFVTVCNHDVTLNPNLK